MSTIFDKFMDAIVNDPVTSQRFISDLLDYPWLITGRENERRIIKQYASPQQQERYAYLLMQRLLK